MAVADDANTVHVEIKFNSVNVKKIIILKNVFVIFILVKIETESEIRAPILHLLLSQSHYLPQSSRTHGYLIGFIDSSI